MFAHDAVGARRGWAHDACREGGAFAACASGRFVLHTAPLAYASLFVSGTPASPHPHPPPQVRNGPINPRGFSNLGAMVAVLRKYNVTHDVVTDRNVSRLTFAEQAQLFGRYGLVIVAHGAGETNLAFLPRRAAVIEISPVMLWCPLCVIASLAEGARYMLPWPAAVGEFAWGPTRRTCARAFVCDFASGRDVNNVGDVWFARRRERDARPRFPHTPFPNPRPSPAPAGTTASSLALVTPCSPSSRD